MAAGVITPLAQEGDPLEDCPDIRLAPGTPTALIATVTQRKLVQLRSSDKQPVERSPRLCP